MSKELIYRNENGSIKIKKYEALFKDKLISLFINSDIDELYSLNIFDNNLTNDNIKDKIESLISNNEKIQIFILEDKTELIGLYFLNKTKEDPYISFIIDKSQRNKGYGKLGLFLLISELSNLYPNIQEYFFKLNKKNIFANLIILGNNAEKINETETEILYKIQAKNKIWIHRIGIGDISEVMKITNQAKDLLKKSGSLQWQQGYPNEETFTKDIKNNSLYGLFQDKDLIAFGAYIYGKDLNYVEIEGKWDIPANDKDMAIHRVAVEENSHGKKLGEKILKYGIQYARKLGCVTVKVDTHRINIPMQKSILKSGFVYKGIIRVDTDKLDNLRYAYEIVL